MSAHADAITARLPTLYQDGDTVHAMLGVDRSTEVAHILAKSPAKES
jgi:trk system potassium uptake protein TrkA